MQTMNRKQRRAAASAARKTEKKRAKSMSTSDTSTPTLKDVQDTLDTLEDTDLLRMYDDIQKDPGRFAEHVGMESAADFLASLIEEMRDRNLIFPDSEETTLPEVPAPSIPSHKLH
jgi:hypothetical protein